MDTKFIVGDKVYLEAKIEEINIDRNGATYRITYHNYIGNKCTEWVKEDLLNAKA